MTDTIQRFSFTDGPVRGQWVRLENVLEVINDHQPYPANVGSLLGEMLAAVAMVADGIKFEGAVSLQSRGPGPLTTVLAECRSRHLLRGIARWPEDASLPSSPALPALLGNGQLAITLIPDSTDRPYQGLVAIDDEDLSANLERYFAQEPAFGTLFGIVLDIPIKLFDGIDFVILYPNRPVQSVVVFVKNEIVKV